MGKVRMFVAVWREQKVEDTTRPSDTYHYVRIRHPGHAQSAKAMRLQQTGQQNPLSNHTVDLRWGVSALRLPSTEDED